MDTIIIDEQMKEALKQARLNKLRQTYYNLELDRISLEANEKDTTRIVEQMEIVNKAYNAILNLDIGGA